MYCILFNGPPRSGKDSQATALRDRLDDFLIPTRMGALSLPMRLAGFAILGLPYSEELYEEIKDVPQELFDGATLRSWMINFSENFMKRNYGVSFWAGALLNPLKGKFNLPGVLIVTDLGFPSEYIKFEEIFGNENTLVVQMHRGGFDFSNDSRGYICYPGARILQVPNLGVDRFSDGASVIVNHCLNRLGWAF